MSKITTFREPVVWQKAMALVVRCYQMVRTPPKDEQGVLGQQIRKSAVSIPSNVAEGFSRHSTALYILHLWMAHASNAELQTQVEVARRVEMISEPVAFALIADAQEVARMIGGLVRSLERGRG
jgi:four helix bundle protein